jgi:hypothetical protein
MTEPGAWLRRSGRGYQADGSLVVWSVAEGRRGRRWREVVVEGNAVRSSLLLELEPGGRFSHVELTTASGLLTLHPEVDATLHGNAVTAGGIRHVAGLEWDRDGAIWLSGSSICLAAGRRPDGSRATAWLDVGLDLALEMRIMRPDWTLVDADGLPLLVGGATWPLEE